MCCFVLFHHAAQYPVKNGQWKTIAEIGLEQFKKQVMVILHVVCLFVKLPQDGFESVMGFDLPWPQWRVPICISYDGLFIHEEIETAT